KLVVWMKLREPAHDRNGQDRRDIGGNAENDLTGTFLLFHFRSYGADLADDADRMRKDFQTGCGGDHAAPVTLEQLYAKLGFEHPNLAAERWLGYAESVGSLVQATQFGDAHNRPKLAEVHLDYALLPNKVRTLLKGFQCSNIQSRCFGD